MAKKNTEAAEAPEQNLPSVYMTMAQNLKAAATTTGAGSGGGRGLYMRVDDRTGAVTAGASRGPVPLKHRYAINLRSFKHGYITF